jgi:two-component system phosphate regulon sensor histidine kinase PhoR
VDADAVKTMVKNLIVNAIHYTLEGGTVSLATSTISIEADGGLKREAIIRVSDTGIGIAKDQQSRVFERFYRVDKSRARDMGGTGLGLAIVKHLSQSFGGSVHLESQLGKGCQFEIRLPIADPQSTNGC